MRPLFLVLCFFIFTMPSFSQGSIELHHDAARVSVMESPTELAVDIQADGFQQKNSVRTFNGGNLKFIATYDDLNNSGYVGIYDNEQNLTLDLIGDFSNQLNDDPPFGIVRIFGESSPSIFPFPGTPGPAIPSIRLVNQIPNDRWDIGFQGHNRGVFPNNETETELVFSYNGVQVANIDETGAYTMVSDQKFKKNIQNLSTVLPSMMKLRPSSYQMGRQGHDLRNIGFIAQNVREFFLNWSKKSMMELIRISCSTIRV
ncbi:MAG: tail fiber domain-containing protein [Saprospiraceae bacterium]|nr:tail fiber domain-containing protein [Saprospiraceae bacterium]